MIEIQRQIWGFRPRRRRSDLGTLLLLSLSKMLTFRWRDINSAYYAFVHVSQCASTESARSHTLNLYNARFLPFSSRVSVAVKISLVG